MPRDKKGRVFVYVWFDIEDYVTAESAGLPLTALNILKKYHVPAICKVVAEKLRQLNELGRQDVISAIARQDVGYHLDTHSRHPTIYEYLADLDVLEGAREFISREKQGLELFKNTFSRDPSCFGHPGPAWAPHVYPALPEMGIPVYLDETPIINLGDSVYWYCGVLNLNGANRNFILFDYTFENPSGIVALKKKFKAAYYRIRKNKGVGSGGRGGGRAAAGISVLFHLHTAINKKFWDEVNFAYGQNRSTEEYVRPPSQPPRVTQRAWRDLKELIRYMSSFPDVQFITARDASRIYKRSFDITLEREQLLRVARRFSRPRSPIAPHYLADGGILILSPAQCFYAIAKFLSKIRNDDDDDELPARIEMKVEPLGPMAAFRTRLRAIRGGGRGKGKLSTSDLIRAARDAVEFMDSKKCMPGVLRVGVGGGREEEDSAEISPEDFLKTSCILLDKVIRGKEKLPSRIGVAKGKLGQEKYVNPTAFRKACAWKVLPRGFSAPRILEQAKLQAWTLVPAVPPRPPL